MVEIDPGVLDEARAALAAWMNARMPDPAHQTTAESYVSWQVAPAEEFLVLVAGWLHESAVPGWARRRAAVLVHHRHARVCA